MTIESKTTSKNTNTNQCKRHRWRVGASNAAIVDKKIVKETLNIWCEKCDKKIKAYYNSKIKFKRRLE